MQRINKGEKRGKSREEQREGRAHEITSKVVHVARCTKVVKGGRRFSLSTLVVAGDKKGKIGLGLGRSIEAGDAKEKATNAAKKALVKIPLKAGRTLHYDVQAKFCSGRVVLRAAPAGTGIIAGGALRPFLECLGIRDVVAKSIGSNNPHNMLKAALKALLSIRTPRLVAEKRGKKVSELFGKQPSIQDSEEEKTSFTSDIKVG